MPSQRTIPFLVLVWLWLGAPAALAQGGLVLLSLSLDPARVTGGAAVTGTVRLSDAAPAGGVQIDLAAVPPSAATVPSSVTVPAGGNEATFTVQTHPVVTETQVVIVAAGLGPAQTAALTVLPPPAPAALQVGVVVGDPVRGTESSRLGSPKPAGVSASPGDKVLSFLGGLGGGPLSDEDRDDRALRGFADDGSLSVTDSAGTALIRLGAGDPEIRLDTTAQDGDVGIARLLTVETNRAGVSGILALRADNTRGIYRLDATGLRRLALLPDQSGQSESTRDPEEVAISDLGQIAFVARDASGALTLFQTDAAGNPAPLRLAPLFGDRTVIRIRGLQSNSEGDLVFLVDLDGAPKALVRKTTEGLAVVAVAYQSVQMGAGSAATGELYTMLRPRIGRDGTVVFLGTDPAPPQFSNFYVARPGRALEPLLPGSDWRPDDFDAAVADDGTAAVWASRGNPTVTSLFLAPPGGPAASLTLVRPDTGAPLRPKGRLAFGKDGRLFLLAAEPAPGASGEGDPPAGLYQYRPGEVGVAAVAVPGQIVPGKPEMRLRAVTRAPTLSPDRLAIEAEYSTPGPAAVATTGFFTLPLDGTLADGRLVAEEGSLLPQGNRLAMLRELSYNADGTLVFAGLQPGAGPILAAVTPATSASKPRTSTAGRPGIEPLLAIGKPLDQPDRLLQAFLGPPIALGRDRQLLAARFAQAGGAAGEGLFVVDRAGQVTRVAVTGAEFAALVDTAPAGSTAPAAGCSAVYTSADPLLVGRPSVAGQGSQINVVFKARLGAADRFGVFQWLGGVDLLTVGLSSAPLLAGDPVPYGLERWAAGAPGPDPMPPAYLLARNKDGKSRLFQRSAAGLRSVVDPGEGMDLHDFLVTGDGSVCVTATGSSVVGVYQVLQGQLIAVAESGQRLPPASDPDQDVRGLRFSSQFGLMPDSAHAGLLFRAIVVDARGSLKGRGLFRLNPQNRLETLLIEGQTVDRERQLTVTSLADSFDQQSANGTIVTAVYLSKTTGWVLYRIRANAAGTGVIREPLAQERAGLPGVPTLSTMDPTLLLDLPCRSGPLFSLNANGDAALLASDGQRWGIYLFPSK